MKQQARSYKTVIIGIVIIGAIILGFYFLGPSKSDSSLTVELTPEANMASLRILSLLKQIQLLEIDNSIFKDLSYGTLVDYTVEIPEVNVGRPNPFAPITGSTTTGM